MNKEQNRTNQQKLTSLVNAILTTPVQETLVSQVEELIALMASWPTSVVSLELVLQPIKKRTGLTVLDFLAQFQSVPGFIADERYSNLVAFYAAKAETAAVLQQSKTKLAITCGNVSIPTRQLA